MNQKDAVKEATVAPQPQIATPTPVQPPAGKPETKETSSSQKVETVQPEEEGVELAANITEHKFALFADTTGLALKSTQTANKKMAPGTVLLKCKDGFLAFLAYFFLVVDKYSYFHFFSTCLASFRQPLLSMSGSLKGMKESDDAAGSLLFQFTNGKENIFLLKGKDIQPMTMREAVTSEQAKGVFKHGSFAAGQLPSRLTASSKLRFAANEAKFASALCLANKTKAIEPRWMMKTVDGNLSPIGFVLVAKRQMIIKPGMNRLETS